MARVAVNRDENSIVATMARALELTEQALGQVARIAIEEIHTGLESSNHVQAAERDMRSALRQLVLAEREIRSRPAARSAGAERADRVSGVVRHHGAEPQRDRGDAA